jgi:4-methyl-5(b-hydroxyethyl)-thiazole monophosphate biosynthesis
MVVFFLANGFEELEAIAPIDILRRGGVKVVTAGVGGKVITGSHGIPVTCDITAEELDYEDINGVVLPGGMPGTKNLAASPIVADVLNYCYKNRIKIGAICAAPSVLGGLGLLDGARVTCFPGYEDTLKGASVSSEYVVRQGNFITAKGAGVAAEFGLTLLAAFRGMKTAEKIRAEMQFK